MKRLLANIALLFGVFVIVAPVAMTQTQNPYVLSAAKIATALGYTPANCTAGVAANNCVKLNSSGNLSIAGSITSSADNIQGINILTAGGNFIAPGAFRLKADFLDKMSLANNAGTTATVVGNATANQFTLFGADGTSAGVYASGANVGVSCTVGLLNPVTAIVINGIITHC